ncbi:MAG: hypothetical protein M3Y08_08985 [Fibrobacterota bacterium]|nr:hypothetical protein [Fibrobacterota bacterium]
MNHPGRGPKGRRSALAGIASFFRQLSLFDPSPVPVETLSVSSQGSSSIPARQAQPSVPGLFPKIFSPIDFGGLLSQPGALAPVATFSDLCRGPYAHIRVEIRKRLWESWRVAWVRHTEELRMQVPAILEEAPVPVKEAVLEWALLVTRRGKRRDAALRTRRAELESLIRGHLRVQPSEGGGRSKTASLRLARNRRREARLEPKGAHHDLDASFREVNAQYFQGSLDAKLTWSARLGGLSTHSIAEDGQGKLYHLISISRGYDSAEVTPEILGGVVYHECLHIAIPPKRENGRRVVHGPDFRKREREYGFYELWRRWHRDGLPKALRRLRRS